MFILDEVNFISLRHVLHLSNHFFNNSVKTFGNMK